MNTSDARILELETELNRLKEELKKARERMNDVEDVRTTLLYTFEDMDEVTTQMDRGKKEWETTFDAISDPIFIHDKDFNILRVNKAYAEAAEMSFKEIIGKPYYQVFPKMDGPCQVCRDAMGSQTNEEDELSIPSLGRIFKVRSFPIMDRDGTFLYSVHIMEDITEQKMSESLILDSELKYRNLFDNLNDAVFLADAETGHIIDTNKQGEVLLNRSREEIIGMHQRELHPPGKAEEYRHRFENHIKRGRAADYDGEVIRKEGSIVPVNITASSITIGGRRLIVGMFRDITERQEAMERLEEEVEINKALLDMADGISTIHDKDEMIRRVVDVLPTVVDAERCAIFLWDKEGNAFLPAHVWEISSELRRYVQSLKLTSDIPMIDKILKGEKVNIEDVLDTNLFPRDVAQILATRSILYMPIIGKSRVIGFIGADRIGIPRPFGKREELFLQGVTHQISVVLDNIRLYRDMIDKTIELSQKVETLRVMHEIDRSILSSLDSQDILEIVAQMVSTVIPSDRVTISLVDKEKGGFIYKAGFGTEITKGIFIPFEDTVGTEVVKTGRPQVITDLTLEKESSSVERRLIEEGYRSHIRIPLTVKGEVIGVFSAGSKRAAAFTSDHLIILEKLADQIAVALENARLVSDLRGLILGIIKALSVTIDAKSPWTSGHSERVTKYSMSIARKMGMDENCLKDLEIAGLLHDIGKIGTYDTILEKPGRLTDEELKIMQNHPIKSAAILAPIQQLKEIVPVVRHHHEFYNGRGYPEGLKGEAIPLMSRILTVADTIDAMSADRPYRKGKPMDAIVEELKRCSGSQFDPKVVDAFLSIRTQI